MKELLRKLLTVVLLFVGSAGVAFAYDIEVDGFYYNIDVPSLTASLTYGENKYAGEVTVPSSFVYNGRTFSVTSLDQAFQDCQDLTSVKIPSYFTTLKNNVFKNAGSLTTVDGLENIIEVGDYAFYGCSALHSVKLSDECTTIGTYAFAMSGIVEFTFPPKIDNVAPNLFEGCDLLEKIELNDGILTIGASAFKDCTSLSELKIPATVTHISKQIISGCSKIKEIKIPTSVTEIAGRAFDGTKLDAIIIDNSPVPLNIGHAAWADCIRFHMGRNIIYQKSLDLDDWYYYEGGMWLDGCQSLEILTFGPNVQEIPDRAFEGQSNLKYLRIPNNISSYGNYAFNKMDTEIWINSSMYIPSSLASSKYVAGWMKTPDKYNWQYHFSNDAVACNDNRKYIIIGHGYNSAHNNGETVYIGSPVSNNDFFIGIKKFIIGESITQLTATITSLEDIEYIKLLGTTPPEASNFSTQAYLDTRIIVPQGSMSNYKNHPVWGSFFNIEEAEKDDLFNPWELWLNGIKENADHTTPTVITNTAGRLTMNDLSNTKYLKIIGQLDGSDMRYLRALMGSNSEADWRTGSTKTGSTSGVLKKLDLSEARIVAGGESYYDYKTLPGNDVDEIRTGYRHNSLTTQNYVIGNYLFNSCSSLNELWLPLNHKIQPEAFDNTLKIQKLIISDVTPPGPGLSKLVKGCTVYVPDNSLSEYENSENWNFLTLKSFSDLTENSDIEIDFENVSQTFELAEGDVLDINGIYGWNPVYTVSKTYNPLSVLTNEHGEFFAAYEGISYAVIENNLEENSRKIIKFVVNHIEISLNSSSITLKEEEKYQLTATVLPDNTTDKTVTWSSSDENIAIVSEEGMVTAISIGNAVITARCGDVVSNCKVKVEPILAETIVLNRNIVTLSVGETCELEAVVSPENTTNKELLWSSSDNDIASVSTEGIITARAPGNAVITARCGDIVSNCDVKVEPILAETIELNRNIVTLSVGESAELEVVVLPENTTNKKLSWSISDPHIAGITGIIGSAKKRIVARSPGEATITVSCDEATAACKVMVIEEEDSIENILQFFDSNFSVYTVDGLLIKKDCNKEILKTLRNGFYIIVCENQRYKILI